MSWSFFRVPSVISGNSGKLLPPSVTRAAEPPMGLRDRIRAAKGVVAKTPMRALSGPMGGVVSASSRSLFTAPKAIKKLKFW